MSTFEATDLFLVQRGDVLHRMPASRLSISRPWTPEDLPQATLLSWLDASDLSTVTLGANGGVAEWRDKAAAGSALSRVFAQSTLNSQPPLEDPWIGTAGAGGGNLRQQNALLPLPYVAVRVNAALPAVNITSNGLLIAGGNTFETSLWHYLATPSYLATSATGSFLVDRRIGEFAPIPAPEGAPYVSSAGYGLTPLEWSLRVNGAAGTIRDSVEVPRAAMQDVAGVAIAQHLVLAGGTAENAEAIEKLEGWAAHKYGFAEALAEGHPYRDAAPTVEDAYDQLPLVGDLFLVQRGDAQYQVSGAEMRAWLGVEP